MRILRIFFVFCFSLSAHHTELHAQSSVHTAGADALGTGGTASFSIGQVMYTGIEGQGGYAGSGVQQPYTITMVGSIDPAPGVSVSFFPNPVQENDFLVINMDSGYDASARYSIEIRDLYGKRLIVQEMNEMSTAIPVGDYASGLYLLTVLKNDSTIRIFKVVKTK